MKISYNWLSNYLSATPAPEELSKILTAVGLEVEDYYAYESVKGSLAGVVVGEVLTCEKHPQADKLKLTTVNIGSEILKIVCGAPNVEAGQKVAVAMVGTTIYPKAGEPITLKKAKIRGEESEGMICAEDELGLGESHAGIMILDSGIAVGTSAAAVFGIYSDTVFEIGLTPNRSDAFSHIGVAREVAAYMQVHQPDRKIVFKNTVSAERLFSITKPKSANPITVEVVDESTCPRYCGIYLEEIKVAESPAWLQNNLKAIGLRPINNVVDVTNFVLHECGQPLHAFDASQISGGKIIVKKATSGEEFITLDSQKIKLNEDDLMICDSAKSLCIAGVMGSLESGVTNSTTKIFLESAWFNPSLVRKTSSRYHLRTDSALHFEKRIDTEGSEKAMFRAVQLLSEIAGAENISAAINTHPQPLFSNILIVRFQKINDLIGIDFDKSQIKKILTALFFTIQNETETGFELLIPSHKTDITCEADVIEEILRLHGLDNIPMPSSVNAVIPIQPNDSRLALREQIANQLAAVDFNEMLNNSLTKSAYYKTENAAVKLLNSINTELNMLRQNLLFGGLEVVAHNQNRQQQNQLWFEFGKTYQLVEANYVEQDVLQIIVTGSRKEKDWQAGNLKADFFFLKETIIAVLNKCGFKNIAFEKSENENLENCFSVLANNKKVGMVGEINSTIANQFGIKQTVWSAELDWKSLEKTNSKKQTRYREISKYPAVHRDLALVIGKEISYEQIEKIASKQIGKQLKEVSLFDIYMDKKIGEDKKSYAVSFTLQDEEKTLTDDKIDGMMNKLIATFEKELNADIRK